MQKGAGAQLNTHLSATSALDQLLDLFQLETIQDDHFIGQSLDLGFRNLFGGHILGQSLVAAGNTCAQRRAHSLHAYFIRGGDPLAPIDYKVERVRDGNTFSVRRVVASQADKAILILSASFQADERGFEHQLPMPQVPAPESLPSAARSSRPVPELIPLQAGAQGTPDLAFDIRPIDPVDPFHPEKRPPHQSIWFRAAGPVQGDQALHQCLLAYASDFGLLGTSLRPHAATYYQPNMVTASLDHAMWFYNDFRIDDWLLYDCTSPAASQARGLNHGNIFRRDGTLVACVTQEGLIRRVPGV
ncbi:MAG: acyl-CoA thioesterase II [Burkholderiales bacterium]|uniref:acyl-CoA thioesterase n=1 Tax=Candidatus Aalborgicola defluviihabitans TaxID=3386187 RepID=UPI001DBA97C7|nr:acyl-CoA thioesterase II [Burkholderiales bacterium]MBK6569924.1 acyl-CoA thioesterase II [Burkholderiales bacterium]MBK7281665.1 acyl-CoA thioesterase II [Burkholderiales bacterium]MBK7315376.1 acyl-CoA thioesterase II [Burkholderiales bacterium]MBL0242815.1 acyl-CoA thioesterase II [Rhodoferax sp.]